jgi:hypothetical protein
MDLMMLTNLQDSVFSLAAGVRTIQRIEYAIPNSAIVVFPVMATFGAFSYCASISCSFPFLFLLYYHLPALSVLTAASIKL